MATEVTVRDASSKDLQGLTAVRYADHPAIHLDRLRDAAAHHMHYLVAEWKGTIVGLGLLVFERPAAWPDTAPTDHLPLIIDLFVTEEFRSRGIGTFMVRHMEKLVLDAGFDCLYLSVDPIDNQRALDFYARLGYEPLETEPYRGHWRFEDSNGIVHEGEQWTIDLVKTVQACG
jgi:GNAT superfamily N-acetyltransferase